MTDIIILGHMYWDDDVGTAEIEFDGGLNDLPIISKLDALRDLHHATGRAYDKALKAMQRESRKIEARKRQSAQS